MHALRMSNLTKLVEHGHKLFGRQEWFGERKVVDPLTQVVLHSVQMYHHITARHWSISIQRTNLPPYYCKTMEHIITAYICTTTLLQDIGAYQLSVQMYYHITTRYYMGISTLRTDVPPHYCKTLEHINSAYKCTSTLLQDIRAYQHSV